MGKNNSFYSEPKGSGILLSLRKAGLGTAMALACAFEFCPAEDRAPIRLGMSTALTGPASELGLNVRDGYLAAFESANQLGGIHHRKLELVALDDGYEPVQAASNTEELIHQHQVLAIVGNLGTPTATVSMPIAEQNQTLFYGAITGSNLIRKDPRNLYVGHFRASYDQETEAIIDGLVRHGIKPHEIGFFTQRDSFGDSVFAGAVRHLQKHGVRETRAIVHGRYERNTVLVEDGIAELTLHSPHPKAVLLVGTFAPCAEFIKKARMFGMDSLFIAVSFVGAEPLAHELKEQGEGVVVSQVVPHCQQNDPGLQEYRKSLRLLPHQPAPNHLSLEGYLSARLLLESIQKIDGEIHRKSIATSLKTLGEVDLKIGVLCRMDSEQNQASNHTWLTAIEHSKVVPTTWDSIIHSVNTP